MKPLIVLLALMLSYSPIAFSQGVKVGEKAPLFELKDQNGAAFSLESRRGVGWTVLYFYPKAGTPGCTTQACAFRDALKAVRDLHAEVYGVSTDTVSALKAFHDEHHLNFTLFSDADARVTDAYGVKMPVVNMAIRWTFIIDPDLNIRDINDDVDPALDAKVVAQRLKGLQMAH